MTEHEKKSDPPIVVSSVINGGVVKISPVLYSFFKWTGVTICGLLIMGIIGWGANITGNVNSAQADIKALQSKDESDKVSIATIIVKIDAVQKSLDEMKAEQSKTKDLVLEHMLTANTQNTKANKFMNTSPENRVYDQKKSIK